MKLLYAFRFFPVLLIESKRLVPSRFSALNVGPIIFVRPGHATMPLIEHELQHARQMYRTCFGMALLYGLSKRWRMRYEAEAYRAQWEAAGSDSGVLDQLANFLASDYRLGIPQDAARTAILTARSSR